MLLEVKGYVLRMEEGSTTLTTLTTGRMDRKMDNYAAPLRARDGFQWVFVKLEADLRYPVETTEYRHPMFMCLIDVP
jgi:hypothetical protein